jgi:hypothetical protein
MANQTARRGDSNAMLSRHRDLMHEIADLQRWWKELYELGIPKYAEMAMRLNSLRNELRAHFENEEAGGYLAAALAAAPEFAREAKELQAQHPQLLSALDQFIAQLQNNHPSVRTWDEARQRLEDFLLRLRDHEAAENTIVQAAFDNDLGAGD